MVGFDNDKNITITCFAALEEVIKIKILQDQET